MNKALIIIDIQNDYFRNGRMELVGAEQATQNAKLILEKFRDERSQVIHIKHIARRPGATYFMPGTAGAEIHTDVKPKMNEKVIVKHYPNSFRETELLGFLKVNHITDLVICGMITHMCVDSTTRAAKDFGFSCTVIGDACATKELGVNGQKVKAEEVQQSFLAALNYFYSTVVNTEEYIKGEQVLQPVLQPL